MKKLATFLFVFCLGILTACEGPQEPGGTNPDDGTTPGQTDEGGTGSGEGDPSQGGNEGDPMSPAYFTRINAEALKFAYGNDSAEVVNNMRNCGFSFEERMANTDGLRYSYYYRWTDGNIDDFNNGGAGAYDVVSFCTSYETGAEILSIMWATYSTGEYNDANGSGEIYSILQWISDDVAGKNDWRGYIDTGLKEGEIDFASGNSINNKFNEFKDLAKDTYAGYYDACDRTDYSTCVWINTAADNSAWLYWPQASYAEDVNHWQQITLVHGRSDLVAGYDMAWD